MKLLEVLQLERPSRQKVGERGGGGVAVADGEVAGCTAACQHSAKLHCVLHPRSSTLIDVTRQVMEYVEEYLGLRGRAFAEEFVLRKQMDGVQQVSSKKTSGGGGGGAWGTAGGGANSGAGDTSSEWEGGIPGVDLHVYKLVYVCVCVCICLCVLYMCVRACARVDTSIDILGCKILSQVLMYKM